MTLYRVTFTNYEGVPFKLDTTDAAKIGPWLAEMYGHFPYEVRADTTVEIRAIDHFMAADA